MYFPKLKLTAAGNALIVKGLAGGTINFTKLALGSGADPGNRYKALVSLVNPEVDIKINSITPGEGLVEMEGSFDIAALDHGIIATEFGVYADDPGGGEILYAYANAGENAAYLPAYSTSSYERITFKLEIVVGDAEHVTATIGEYSGYARLEDFNAHVANETNPHNVTKTQIGLGNVPNVSTNNQTPTFAALTSSQQSNPATIPLNNITSGETLSVMLGKIRNAIARLIHHISATNNPHNVTKTQIGLGNVDNTSDANKPVSTAQRAAIAAAANALLYMPYITPQTSAFDKSASTWATLDLSSYEFWAPVTLLDLSNQPNDRNHTVDVRFSSNSFALGGELRVTCERTASAIAFSYRDGDGRVHYTSAMPTPASIIYWGTDTNGTPILEAKQRPTTEGFNTSPPTAWWT